MTIQKYFDNKQEFEKQYCEIRQKEERILHLNEIRKLPVTSVDYVHHKEWSRRINSTSRFCNYLKAFEPFALLDVGCGNGWLLNKLSNNKNTLVGIDVNEIELKQANDLLKNDSLVTLIYGDLFQVNFETRFDFIVLNASAQYFPELDTLIQHLKTLLSANGEIHIMDSPIYKSRDDVSAAASRSRNYYLGKGIPEMAEYYFHHSYQDIEDYSIEILYNPDTVIEKIKAKFFAETPFPWIRIKFAE